MPARNSKKDYLENGYYHLYNRGVEKRLIFQDEQDYAVFLSYLKTYLLPKNEKELEAAFANPETPYNEREKILALLHLNNFNSEIKLLSYSLMPNHFHLLVKQASEMAIDKFMNSLNTRYTMYFNKKYKPVGCLYQGVYKAVLIDSDEQLLQLSRYIHRNSPLLENKSATKGLPFRACQNWVWEKSSLPEYLGQRKTEWIHPEEILSYFSKSNPQLSYQSFVEETEDLSLIGKQTLDIDF